MAAPLEILTNAVEADTDDHTGSTTTLALAFAAGTTTRVVFVPLPDDTPPLDLLRRARFGPTITAIGVLVDHTDSRSRPAGPRRGPRSARPTRTWIVVDRTGRAKSKALYPGGVVLDVLPTGPLCDALKAALVD